jgi:tRNA dimethylallyltransferase
MTEPARHAPPVLLLAGPTAVGKTELSLTLAEALGTEIVNADSIQVYRHLEIGAAKPTAEERARVPHHLIDIASPDEPFDAARYLECARPVIEGLRAEGKPPLVVGGTGLYMKVLTRGICEGPKTDPEIRRRLEEDEAARGLAALHAELLRVDPVSGARIHPNDRQRVLRALEVFRATGLPLSARHAGHGFKDSPYRTVKVFLTRPREELYARIERRVDAMMEAGFLDEVRGLLAMGFGPECKPMLSLGYRQMLDHILSGVPLAEAVSRVKVETRRYAKRQMTWFRADPEFVWMDAEAPGAVLDHVRKRLAEVP